MELGSAPGLMSCKTFVSSDWRVSFCFWVMLSCDRVCFRDLVVLCVVLEISYLLKLYCMFRLVEDVQSTVPELRDELCCGVFVGWWWAVELGL